MCSMVSVTLCLLVFVGNAAAGTVREKRCGNFILLPDTSNSTTLPTDPTNSIRRVILPDFTLEGQDSFLISQVFTQNYSAGPMIVEWTILLNDGDREINLILHNITLTESTDCQDEYLEVRSVIGNESQLVLRTCGARAFAQNIFHNGNVNFQLYLQDAQNDYGVYLEWWFSLKKKYDYSELHLEPSGEILSLNYPSMPEIGDGGIYYIIAPPYQRIKLTINDFDIPNSGCETNRKVYAKMNDVIPEDIDVYICDGLEPIYTTTNWMQIVFFEYYASIVGRGFNFTFESLPLDLSLYQI